MISKASFFFHRWWVLFIQFFFVFIFSSVIFRHHFMMCRASRLLEFCIFVRAFFAWRFFFFFWKWKFVIHFMIRSCAWVKIVWIWQHCTEFACHLLHHISNHLRLYRYNYHTDVALHANMTTAWNKWMKKKIQKFTSRPLGLETQLLTWNFQKTTFNAEIQMNRTGRLPSRHIPLSIWQHEDNIDYFNNS